MSDRMNERNPPNFFSLGTVWQRASAREPYMPRASSGYGPMSRRHETGAISRRRFPVSPFWDRSFIVGGQVCGVLSIVRSTLLFDCAAYSYGCSIGIAVGVGFWPRGKLVSRWSGDRLNGGAPADVMLVKDSSKELCLFVYLVSGGMALIMHVFLWSWK